MKKKIFLVEDDAAIVEVYKLLLEQSGFDVVVFGTGKTVIDALVNEQPAVILLDLTLPDMNGMEVLMNIKKSESTKDIKVFILTNQSGVTFDDAKPERVIIKADTTPSQLAEILKKEL